MSHLDIVTCVFLTWTKVTVHVLPRQRGLCICHVDTDAAACLSGTQVPVQWDTGVGTGLSWTQVAVQWDTGAGTAGHRGRYGSQWDAGACIPLRHVPAPVCLSGTRAQCPSHKWVCPARVTSRFKGGRSCVT